MAGRGHIALAGLLTLAVVGCAEERERDPSEGTHAAGWADPASAGFHGDDLQARGYPLAECRGCHGQDYGGGAVDVSCRGAGCHTEEGGPEFCGTCHGGADGPMPDSGRHATHEAFCADCHQVPDRVDSPGHIDGDVDLVFAGLARADGRAPSWDAEARGCSDVYCHQSGAPSWDDATPLDCNGCHDTPAIHGRFARVVAEDTCAGCHQGSPATGHVDGAVQLAVDGCTGCHGSDTPAPPTALDGATAATDLRVGAHRRHLDGSLADRIADPIPCTTCHDVPATLFAAGHLDDAAPADVDVDIGDYDPAAGTCTSWCHGDATPAWNDASGAARQCGACHEFPPTTTSWGGPHPTVAPDVDECRTCHVFDPATHVDGEVSLQ